MSVNTQEIIDKYNQLSPKLQQEALNYIDFLIYKYGIEVPEPKKEEEDEDETTSNEVEATPVEVVEKQVAIEKIADTVEVAEEVDTQEKVEKEELPSEEDLKLDEEIAEIEEKKKDKMAPDWHEVKQAFKDEFF